MIAGIESTSLIVVAVFILTMLGVAYGLKTRKGSGLNDHPGPDAVDPVIDPDAAEPAESSDAERADGTVLDQHGTK